MTVKGKENLASALSVLQLSAEKIRQVEAEAQRALSADDTGAYRQKLHEKTMLLMELPEEVEPFLDGIPKDARAEIKAEVRSFARRASQARELSSIFYMSALLYPDDHKEGQMNDLEAFIDRLREKYLSG